ncbi:MAG TPA: phosphoribosylglycinamide formyltransferase, partial [Clostridiaceae bacterium]|nr:phosphoribosylglycinamide formyltransferase [Clostridiaceae bacterium]
MMITPVACQAEPLRVAVFVSGGGTNLQTLIDAAARGDLGKTELVKVVASRQEIKAIERAEKAGLPVAVIRRADFSSQLEYDQALIAALADEAVDLVVLAGFLTRLGPEFIRAYQNRIINIHPSLLPQFGGPGFYGLKPHEAVLAAG